MSTYRGSPSGPAIPNTGMLLASVQANEADGAVPVGGVTWTVPLQEGKQYFVSLQLNVVCPAPPDDVSAAVALNETGLGHAPVAIATIPAITNAAGAPNVTLATMTAVFTCTGDAPGLTLAGFTTTWLLISTKQSRLLSIWEV